MRIFKNIEEVIKFIVRSNDIVIDYSYNEIRNVINKGGDGFYGFMIGSRNEIELVKVNLIEELREWNELDNDNEFKYLNGNWNDEELDRENDLLELGFDEEDWRIYFCIVKKKSWFEIKNLV